MPQHPDQISIGVAGCGHFGRFHAQKVAANPRARLAGVYDADPARAAERAQEMGCPALSWADLLAASQAVVIAAPAAAHFDLADAALRAGRHVLVEKPIAETLAQADALDALAQARGLVLQVGHLLRFTPEFAAIRAHMPSPVFIDCVRIAPFKPRGTDVSVVLDLMIHDLDLVLALVDSPLVQVDAVGAPVSSPLDDIANARLRFANGCVATITASRISLRTERKMHLFGQDAYISVDFSQKRLNLITRNTGTPIPGSEGHLQEITWADQDAMAAEHAAFVASVLDGAPVAVDAAAGRRALEAALMVSAAIDQARAQAIASGLLRHV